MKENQRVTITKRMLKESLLALLKEKDLDSITVSELCSRAQINRTTFYRYYKLPADVFSEIEKGLVEDMQAAIDGIKTEADAKNYLLKLCRDCQDKSGIVGYFLRYDFGNNHASVLGNLYKNSERNFFDRTDSEDEYSKIVGTYFAGGSYFILRMWAEGEIERTPEEMASLLFKLMTSDYSSMFRK
ncbi:MAG: TetR/AcrR family transcriptional regulator [Clostridia bacterium]|nr:TetR/AcrR family transcriptional regulator [Clostridia bacterium]